MPGPVSPFVDNPSRGVIFADPGIISSSIKSQVSAALAEIPKDKTLAIVGVATWEGWNTALAARVGDDLQVVGWIGKKGWDKPLVDGVTGGIYVKATF